MPFPFTCPSCRHTSQVPDSLAGTQARCPTCSTVVTIPGPVQSRSPTANAPPLPKLEPAIDDEKLASRMSEVRLAPGPAGKKKGGIAVVLIAGSLFFCCGGLGLAGFYLFRSKNVDVANAATSRAGFAPTIPVPPTRPTLPTDDSNLPLNHWVALLRDGGDSEAVKARKKLLEAGPLAVPELRKALSDKSPRLRLAAVALLGELRDLSYEAVDDIAKRLRDSEPTIRETAASALGQIGKPARTAYADLVRASTDPNARVRATANETLRQFGSPEKDDVPKLLALLNKGDRDQKLALANAVEELKPSPEIRQALFTPLLNDAELSVRLFAIRVIASNGMARRSESLALLFPLLEDKSAEVRTAAIAALRGLAPMTERDLSPLQTGLGSSYAESRRFCMNALAALGPKAEPALPFLAKALRDTDPEIRTAASATLAAIGKPCRDVLQDLVQARMDRQPEVRKNVIVAMSAVGRDERALESLFLATGDSQADVRTAACDGLKKLEPPLDAGDLLSLYPLLQSPHVEVRRFCAAELARMGKESEPILVKMQDALKDEDPQVRASLYAAFGKLGPKAKGVAPHLIETMQAALERPNIPGQDQVFRQAALTLAKIGQTSQAVPVLRTAMKEKNSPLLKDVLEVLASAGPVDKSLAPDLLALAGQTGVRPQVAKALARIGKPVLNDLIRIVDKGNCDEKLTAILAIELIGPEAKSAFVDLRQVATTHKDKEVVEAAKKAMREINRFSK